MTAALPHPDHPDGLTPAWLTAALRDSGRLEAGTAVTAVEVTSVGTGQMSDSLRLRLSYDRDTGAPASLIAKLPSTDGATRATALALGSYENEVRFYQELAPRLPVRTPVVHLAWIDPATASFVLLLEDLAPARAGDQLAGCSPAEAAVALRELVNLHAPRWDDSTLADLPWLHRDPEAGRQFLLMLLPGCWDGFRDRYRDDLGPEVHEAGDALFAHLEAYLLADTAPWTVAHGDYRLDNLLFDPDPDRPGVTVVDWQTVTHGPGLSDVAYLLGAGLDPAVRPTVEEGLVRDYHAGLLGAGVAGYDWDRCWADYRRGTWAGLVMAVAASMLVERTDRGDLMFLTMAARHSRHALDLEAAAVIGT